MKKDKELLLFPFISGIACLLVFASFALPLFATDSWQPPGDDATMNQRIMYYAVLFLFYFCNYFQAALYLYARQNQAPAGFQPELLNNALRRGLPLVPVATDLDKQVL